MMEIKLGMTQEEGLNCLLCLLPRCVCHITIELTKLELKLKVLKSKDKEEEGQGAEEVVEDGKEVDEPGEMQEGRPKLGEEAKLGEKVLLAEGNLCGLLEEEGLTSNEEGSLLPQEPAGNLEAVAPDSTQTPSMKQTNKKEEETQP